MGKNTKLYETPTISVLRASCLDVILASSEIEPDDSIFVEFDNSWWLD